MATLHLPGGTFEISADDVSNLDKTLKQEPGAPPVEVYSLTVFADGVRMRLSIRLASLQWWAVSEANA